MKIKLLLYFLTFSLTGWAQLADQGTVVSIASKNPSIRVFYEVNGIVSMEAEHADYMNGWKEAALPMDTKAMEADSAFSWKGGVLLFNIDFKNTGRYALWILARKGRCVQNSCNVVEVWPDRDLSKGNNPGPELRNIRNDGLIVVNNFQPDFQTDFKSTVLTTGLNIPETHFMWSTNPAEGNGPVFWDVKKAGRHHLEFLVGDDWQFAIDKIVLTLNNLQPPSGRGPAETSALNVIPVKKGFDADVILPPAWAFGFLYGGYTNQMESEERVQAIIDHDYPIDGYWIDSWFWDFTNGGKGPKGFLDFRGDSIAFPAPGAMWNYFEQRNVKAGIWIWDIILKDGNESVFSDFEKNGAFQYVFKNTESWHNDPKQSLAGQINFSDPKATLYFQQRLKPLFDQGLDFLKLDRDPDVPFAKGVFEAIQMYGKESKGRAFIMQHVGSLSDPAFKRYPTKWSGDSEIAWDLPQYPSFTNYTKGGFKQNVEMVAAPQNYEYEVPFLTHDGGGFRIIGCKDFGEELFMRWIQFSVFNPVTEVFQSLFNSHSNLAWEFSPRAHQMFTELSHFKLRLFPYIYTYAHLTRLEGEKMIRGDGINKYQYLFGKEFLVGPVVEKGATTKEMVFPSGKWIDYRNGKIYEGGTKALVDAPVTQIPLFVKAGAIIPMRDYARSVTLGNNNRLTLDIYPYGNSFFNLIEDDGESNDYLNGAFSQTKIECSSAANSVKVLIGAAEGKYTGMPQTREWVLTLHAANPHKVLVNGKAALWEYKTNGICQITLQSDIHKSSSIELFYE